MSDAYDSPWKDILEDQFPDFMAPFFAAAAAEIDFASGVEGLDKELAQVVLDAERGPRLADKPLKVWLTDGGEQWLLVHIEVQGQPEVGFAERRFVYAYRIYDRFQRAVVSLAVVADEAPCWRRRRFHVGSGTIIVPRTRRCILLSYSWINERPGLPRLASMR